MGGKTKLAVNAPAAKRTVSSSQTQRAEPYQPVTSPVEHTLFLQRTIGNRAVQRLFKSGVIQAKLKIGGSNDIDEQEADRVADQVMRMPDTAISDRPSAIRGDDAPLQMKPREEEFVRRRTVAEEIHRFTKVPGHSLNVKPSTESAIRSLEGGGQPLSQSDRAFFETRFGYDFSKVQVHSGAAAEQSAQDVNAHAYTVGENIVFGAGRFTPGTQEGLRPIAHELTHVVQHEGTILTTKGEKPSNKSSAVPKKGADAEKASPLQPKKESEFLSPIDEIVSERSPAEGVVGKEILRLPATPGKAPASPEEDSAYQAVVEELKIRAKNERTPSKKPEQKQKETILAANTESREIIDIQKAYGNHLNKLEQVQPHELTVKEFMGKFDATINKLAKKLPENKEERGSVPTAVELAAGKVKATQEVAQQDKTHSEPLRKEVTNNASDYRDKKQESKTYELKVDPVGSTPTIKHANTAVPKPKAESEVSLDDKSRALDDALLNHNVDGQTINIDEGSLAFPISGEKTFDEAGEAKRKAQEEIKRANPRYRQEEMGVISKSEDNIHSLVNIRGLEGHHGLRSASFKAVLGEQKSHKNNIKKDKQRFFTEFHNIYDETKDKVKNELDELEKPQSIEETFESILSQGERDFEDLVRNDLEYIYTPGFFDYSDWKEKHESKIKEEFEKQKLLRRSRGDDHYPAFLAVDPAYIEALRIVRDRSAALLFAYARERFISYVTKEVEEKIANRVVKALNAAKKHIKEGQDKFTEAYKALDPLEKKEAINVFEAVKGQFAQLQESVDDRQREIIDDMARTYNKSLGKLKNTFDEIKKDVLTSWLEKAWNKLKAILNAIIDFATRIVELLGRLAYLVGDIISSPRYFFNNLVSGIGQGFSTFVERIDEFLATAFFDWLRGSSGMPIQIPKDWGPKGIFSLFTQLLNVSTETIWKRMEIVYDKTVANAFRRGEVLLGKGLEIFAIVRNEGLGGLWEHIKESLGNILEETLEMIKETVLYAAIKKVILEIGRMLVPGGGFIAIAEKVIRLLQFIVEAREKILDLIESFVDSVEMAVKGNVAGIVRHVTGALTKFITIALDFLVTFFGLGGLKEKVERFIERMRNPIIRGIDWVLGKAKPFVMKGKELLEKGKERVIVAGKAVVQVGVPEDPNERLRLAARASVSAARRLTGRVTQALLNPILGAIRVRYGLTAIRPYEKSGTWWVRATINPEVDEDLGVPSEETDQEAVHVREVASRALENELRGAPSRKEAQRIVGQVAERLRSQGLEGLEMGPESSEGVWTIYAEASEKRPLGHLVAEAMKHKEVPRRVDVRTAVELKLAPEPKSESGKETKPAESRRAQLIEPTHPGRRPTGGIELESSTGTELRIVAWNIVGLTSANARDHAEDQIDKELRNRNQKDSLMEKIVEIRIENFDLSPCDDCCGVLNKLLNDIRRAQTGNPKLKTAEIYWQKLYERSEEIPGHHSATQTTWSGIRRLTAGRGWTIHAPPEALPLKETGEIPEDIYRRYVYKKKETTVTVKPETELTARYPVQMPSKIKRSPQ